MSSGEQGPVESSWLAALSGALMLAGPLWHYLYVNRYPMLSTEALALVLGAAIVGSGGVLLARRIGGWMETLAFGTLLYIFLDLQFNPERWTYAIVVLGGCVAAAALLRRRRGMLASISLGTFYLAALPRAATQPAPARHATAPGSSALPVIVHLILDEQWGIGGLRAEGETETANFLSDFYRERGFEVYESAYSRAKFTRQSIPQLLSLGRPYDSIDSPRRPEALKQLHRIPYLETLRDRGYAIRIFQSTYLDLCHASTLPVVRCETTSGNSIANIGGLHGAWTARAILAGRYFLNQTSRLYRKIRKGSAASRSSVAGGGLNTLEHVREVVAQTPSGGTAFFVHVLIPHRPFELDSACRAVTSPAWREDYDMKSYPRDSAWTAALMHLGGQVRCAHRAIGALLATLDSTVGRDHSIVLIHGDHGSRMFRTSPRSSSLSDLNERELNAMFSTLLAVRRPGVPPAIYPEPVPLQEFLWELVAGDFKGPVPGGWRHFVRGPTTDSASTDTLRVLSPAQMRWASIPAGPPPA